MKRTIALLLLASFFLMPALAEDMGSPEPGTIWFSGSLDEEQYVLALHFEQNLYPENSLRAIKITFEPSGTVAAMIYDETCSPEEVASFLGGKAPLSLLKVSSFIRLDPRIYYYPQARHLAEDTAVRVEYLVAMDGEASPIGGPEVPFDDIAGKDLFVTPVN